MPAAGAPQCSRVAIAVATPSSSGAVGEALNRLPKYVASRGTPAISWDGAEQLQGDVIEAVAALKGQPGRELQVHGSGELVRGLLAAGLVDELRLLTFPVLTPGGMRLFDHTAPAGRWELTGARPTPSGIVIATYVPAGALPVGTYEIEEGREVMRPER